MRRGQFLLFVGLLLILLTMALSTAQAAVDASLDRQVIREGETVQLTLEVEGQSNSQPDTSPLERDFDLLGTSSSSQLSIINGRANTRTRWAITLSPKRMGELEIPSLPVGTQQSPTLKLKVEKASAPALDGRADIFIESEALSTKPYVQAQLLLRIRLFHGVDISEGSLSDPSAEQVLVQRIGKDRRFTTYRGGRKYQVFERLYALFPQSSGQMEIAAPVFDGQVPDRRRQRSRSGRIFGNDPFGDLFPTTKKVRVRGKSLAIEVRPQPEAASGKYWLPATAVEMSESWSDEGDEIRVGDPLTRTLSLTVRGLTAAQLPDLTEISPAGVNSYPDKAELTTETEGDKGVIGRRQQKIAYIPTRPGSLELPGVVVEWWDVENDRLERRVLPARRLQVVPATDTPIAAEPPADESVTSGSLPLSLSSPSPAGVSTVVSGAAPGYWPWIAALFALAWLITLLLWWRSGSSVDQSIEPDSVPAADSAAARKRFRTACGRNDPSGARAALIAWGRAEWSKAPPSGLDDVAERFEDVEVRELILQLDHHLYGGGDSWDGTRLLSAVKKLPLAKPHVIDNSSRLPPLYPNKSHF
ncbi:MAG: BatD family protein [Candidatus Sedimenticola sp. (ex Thyasira tokunagai)]